LTSTPAAAAIAFWGSTREGGVRMISDDELSTERWWREETVSAAMEAVGDRWRSHWHVGKSVIGCKGDNRHLRGRHRSRDWTRNSRFCTRRGYGDTDPRDRDAPDGAGDKLRAFDIDGMPPQERWAFNRRLDEAVRAGRLPCVAEWWGTFEGDEVVGWFQGRPDASADDSHLDHTHIGIWTSFVDDEDQLRLLGDIILGEEAEDMTPEQASQLAEVHSLLLTGKRLGPAQTSDGGVPIADEQRQFFELDHAVAGVAKDVAALKEAVDARDDIDLNALAAAVAPKVVALLGDSFADTLAEKIAARLQPQTTG
jgi:hypothetical protein